VLHSQAAGPFPPDRRRPRAPNRPCGWGCPIPAATGCAAKSTRQTSHRPRHQRAADACRPPDGSFRGFLRFRCAYRQPFTQRGVGRRRFALENRCSRTAAGHRGGALPAGSRQEPGMSSRQRTPRPTSSPSLSPLPDLQTAHNEERTHRQLTNRQMPFTHRSGSVWALSLPFTECNGHRTTCRRDGLGDDRGLTARRRGEYGLSGTNTGHVQQYPRKRAPIAIAVMGPKHRGQSWGSLVGVRLQNSAKAVVSSVERPGNAEGARIKASIQRNASRTSGVEVVSCALTNTG